MNLRYGRCQFVLCLWLATHALCARGAELSFHEALQKLIEKDDTLRAAFEVRGSVMEQNLARRAGYLPTLSAQASRSTAQNSYADIAHRSVFELDMGLNVYRFGADSAAMTMADLEESRQEALVYAAQLKAEETAATKLIVLIWDRAQLASLEKIRAMRLNVLQIAQKRFDQGLLASQEVEKLAMDLSSTDIRLYEAKGNLTADQAASHLFLGEDTVIPSWPYRQSIIENSVTIKALSGFTADQLPTVKADQLKAQVSARTVAVARTKFLPSLDLNLGYTRSYLSASADPQNGVTGTLVLTVPLFDKFVGYSDYRASIHLKAADDALATQAFSAASASYLTARELFNTSLKVVRKREELAQASTSIYQQSLIRFEKGVITVNDFNMDQSRLYDMELEADQDWKSLHIRLIELCHAAGLTLEKCVAAKSAP